MTPPDAAEMELMIRIYENRPLPPTRHDGERDYPEIRRREKLRMAGLIYMPEGQRKGWRLTDLGRSIVQRALSNAPQTSVEVRTPQEFIDLWCVENRIDVLAMKVARKSRARMILATELKKRFPDLSATQCGLLLGGIHHTTVTHAWKLLGLEYPRNRERVPGGRVPKKAGPHRDLHHLHIKQRRHATRKRLLQKLQELSS